MTCEFMVSWNTCAVPAKLPRTEEGTPSWVMARLMASLASDSDEPVGRLNDTVEAAESPWWFTDSGAFDGCQLAKYDSGIALPSSLITNILSSALMSWV